MIKAIETKYAGCRFRSRLEARWAVFFDTLGIPWQYEPQGYVIDGRPYLPDFLLPECGTWIEVKGNEADLDIGLMQAAALHLPEVPPQPGCEPGPKLMILGPVPEPREGGDWAWTALTPIPCPQWCDIERGLLDIAYSFGAYPSNRRPWWRGDAGAAASWLVPSWDGGDALYRGAPSAAHAYRAARSARFEHGERGR